MKKLIWLLSISFIFINILGILLYFSFNTNFYVKQFTPTQVTNSNLYDLQNVYSFLQNKTQLNSNFTPLEASHLQDVRVVFLIVNYIFYISLIFFITIIVYFILSKKYNLILKWFFIWSIFSLSIILILLFATIFDFTSIFQSFHRIFFPQWNREFAEDSRLITLFPESFFISISQSIFITISTVSIFVLLLYFTIKKISYRKKI